MNFATKSLCVLGTTLSLATSASAQHDFFRSFNKEVGRLVIPSSGPNPYLVLAAVEPNFDPAAICRLDAAEAEMAGPASWDLKRHGFQSLDFHRLGGMQVLDEDEFLLSGSKTTGAWPYTQEGILYRIRVNVDGINPVSYTILQQVSIPGIDPVRIAWNKNSQQLHIIDYQRRRLVYATWDGTSALPTSYVQVADPTGEIADVLDPIAYAYVAMPGIGSVIEDYSETSFLIGNAATDEMAEIDYTSGSHFVISYTLNPIGNDVLRITGDRTMFGQTLPLTAEIANMTLASATVELRDALTAQVLDSQTVTQGQTLQLSGYQTAFQDDPGRVYLLRDPASQVGGLMFRSQLRYGDPQNQPAFSISRGMMPAYGAAPDYPFGVGVDYTHDGSTGLMAGNLLISTRQQAGGTYSDPVVVVGGQATLTPDFTIPFQFDPTAQGATIGHEVPLSDAHVGSVVMFQYQFAWVDSVGQLQFVTSDVFGTRVVQETWVDPNTVQW